MTWYFMKIAFVLSFKLMNMKLHFMTARWCRTDVELRFHLPNYHLRIHMWDWSTSNSNYIVKTMERICQLHQCLPTIFWDFREKFCLKWRVQKIMFSFRHANYLLGWVCPLLDVPFSSWADWSQTLIKPLQLGCFCPADFPPPVSFCLDLWLNR